MGRETDKMAAEKTAEVEKKAENTEKDGKKETKKGEKQEDELSEEDRQLQDELNMLVERLKESDQRLYRAALESLRTQIRSSITSVPKPLKFLRPHYDSLKEIHEKIKDATTQKFCADVVSVLGMTMSEGRDCLKFRMLGSHEEIGSWGHEYVRHLTGEVAAEWQDLDEEKDKEKKEKLSKLIDDIVPYLMKHN